MFRFLFWAAVIAGAIMVGGQVFPVYYNNMKAENVFEGVAKNMADQSESDIRQRVLELLNTQGVKVADMPDEFLNNLRISQSNGKLQIGSEYHVTLWLIGAPQSVDPDSDYLESEVEPMDKLRLRARMDFDFAPYQETP